MAVAEAGSGLERACQRALSLVSCRSRLLPQEPFGVLRDFGWIVPGVAPESDIVAGGARVAADGQLLNSLHLCLLVPFSATTMRKIMRGSPP